MNGAEMSVLLSFGITAYYTEILSQMW